MNSPTFTLYTTMGVGRGGVEAVLGLVKVSSMPEVEALLALD